jgi:hypothetical protein
MSTYPTRTRDGLNQNILSLAVERSSPASIAAIMLVGT